MNYYLDHVRMSDRSEYVGIHRQCLLMMEKGITLSDMSQAVQNYELSEWVRTLPPVRRQHIRKFFKPENIKQWAARSDEKIPLDPSLSALDRLQQQALREPPPPTPAWKPEPEEEDDDPCDEL